ncbi:undecaprenyl-phosphate glucose phosphotransferase [Mucilaginibacter sp. FT3.2]|uniref:undecaprenyl-phosphate glucose phosphotransferase n=1 Tax=Mucilaginibacter sp. FT3.2 TaxID=2723090 RepID=UPI00160D8B3E|nr:undecaprenyl-phosphate glucose phosphotransferase [Mucilaginibacter sp. FT3.2]MBB6234230.1 putative colanic acid biosynthesis UDP-glucose lipid carrier transferase [Mucilaginibacter sp. FT3.2]
MIEQYNKVNRVANVLVDYLLLNSSLIVVYNFLHHSYFQWLTDRSCLNAVVIFNLLWLFAANLIGLYRLHLEGHIVAKAIKTYLLYVALVWYIMLFVSHIETYYISKEFLLLSLALFASLLIIWKVFYVKTVKYSTVLHGPLKKAVILGEGVTGTELFQRFKNNLLGYELLGLFGDKPLATTACDFHLGNISACMKYVVENKIDEIFCALPFSQQTTIERLIKQSDKNLVRFKLIPEHFDYFQGELRARNLSKADVFSIRKEPLENIVNRILKRAFDIGFSLLVIVLILSWLYPILYILIKGESRGPVYFVQPRSGKDNTTFNCYKFRSMYVNKDADSLQARRGDSRITRIGRFLRRTSLDEMPQFFNVLLGDMSVVGPRPHMLSHTEEYANLIDHFMVRHFIKPGITGWAQVNGLRGETQTLDDMRARVEADMWYMENWSFTLDLKIIFFTFFRTLKGDKYAF